MDGREISIEDLPPMSGEELGELLVNLVVKQNERIADLERQLRNERRIGGDVADAELWRQGALS